MQKAPNRSAQQGRQEIKKTEDNHRISQAKNNRLIVVLGMHRSGTSVISRGLQVVGVDLGDRLMPAMEGVNDKGFWEDIDLNAFNEEILGFLDKSWSSLASIEAHEIAALSRAGYLLRGIELLRQKTNSKSIFGFKDPRVASLLPFWNMVFKHGQFKVSYVIALRHPLSVVKSLIKRDGIETVQGYLLWLGHVIASVSANTVNKRVIVDYDRLMQSPDKELNRIALEFDLKVNQAALSKYHVDFLDNKLRHTIYELQDLFLDSACPPIVQEVYTTLLEVASDKYKDDSELNKKIEQYVYEYQRIRSSLLLVDKLSSKIKISTQVVSERDGQLSALNQELAKVGEELTHATHIVTQRDGQLSALNQELAKVAEELTHATHIVTERDGQIQKILKSNSWRFTSPIRVIGRFKNKIYKN